MELGGNAPCIVDDYVPDLDYTIQRLINGGFYQGGQSCIHMQRLYVHERLYDEVCSSSCCWEFHLCSQGCFVIVNAN